MKWSIPYTKGGLADQSVMLLRSFDLLNRIKMKHEAAEQKKREQEMKKNRPASGRGGRRVAGRR